MLRQWQPQTIRRLAVRGWFPLLLCSTKNTSRNYVVHMKDIPSRGAGYGGNISITNWSLEMLYYENLMLRNRWSRRNNDLDLIRYLGGSFRFYRDPDTDFIGTYSLDTPMKTNLYSHMQTHPQVLLLKRRHFLIPSLKTKPRGKRWVTVRFHPPRLMRNQWYFQSHFCHVNLVQLRVTGLDLQRPWFRKQAETPVVQFAILQPSLYNEIISTAATNTVESLGSKFENLWKFPLPFTTNWRSLLEDMGASKDELKPDKTKISTGEMEKTFNTMVTVSKLKQKFTERQNRLKQIYAKSGNSNATTVRDRDMLFDRIYGAYSYFLLNDQQRYDSTYAKAYVNIRYSPIADGGIGNRVFIQSVLKKDFTYRAGQCYLLLEDQPLWLLLFGYFDWIRKELSKQTPGVTYVCLLNCPYTDPPLPKTNADTGYIFLSDDFCQGRFPYGQYKIAPQYETFWYPCLFNQEPAAEAIVNCGPWMPRDDEKKSWQLNLGYRFNFKLGGNLPPGQPPVDPCKRPTHELPESNMLDLAVQASDPRTVGDDVPFHSWDIRRGLFSTASLKRVRDHETDDVRFASPAEKAPRHDPPVEGSPFVSGSLQALQQLLQTPQRTREEEEAEAEHLELFLHGELQRQREQQKQLKRGLQEVFQSLRLTQMGVHVDQRLL